MSNVVVWLAIGFLILTNIIAFILFLIALNQRQDCQNNQDPHCPQVLCSKSGPDGGTTAAFRYDKKGQQQFSS